MTYEFRVGTYSDIYNYFCKPITFFSVTHSVAVCVLYESGLLHAYLH